ncbi:MAG: hypothetical protein LBQ60_08215, partial [Bacteroidales bacterium]|nr:hypothetical protein [Bacteroidales bacterium]
MKGKKSYGSKDYHIIVLVWSLFFITSCNITKMVPEGRYLVSNVEVKVDTKDINDSQMSSFIRQKPNDPKISLRVYNAYNGDTSRWIVKKMGAPPILYDSSQTDLSARNIRIEMANKGYLNAKVDTIINISGKKIDVTYNVT